MHVIYGKGKVGNGLKRLLDKLEIPNLIMDDSDIDLGVLKSCLSIICSPGIPSYHLIYKSFPNKIINELDFIWSILNTNGLFGNFEFIGITGTDGKSTTTWILYNLLNKVYNGIFQTLGLTGKVWIGGNFDEPLSSIICQIFENKYFDRKNIIILEVSSFMSYKLTKFQFNWSIWTNFHPDHLDWHLDLQDYFNAKFNVIKQTKYKSILNQAIDLSNFDIDNKKLLFYSNIQTNSKFIGFHNQQNISSVLCFIKEYLKFNNINLSLDYFKDLLNDIKPLPHRVEFVKEIEGIKIFDDGKSTTIQSLKAGISCFNDKIVLISGGSDKGDNNYEILINDFIKNVGYGIFIGTTSKYFGEIAKITNIDYEIVDSMEHAVIKSFNIAKQKNIKNILFSPGCASFDMFKNRIDRVSQFLNFVEKL